MKNNRLLILFGVIVLAIAAFWLLDFRLAMSSTVTEKLVMTTDTGENMPVSMQRKEKMSIVMVGEGPQVEALQKVLRKEMKEAGLGEIELTREIAPSYPNPVLIVKVGRPGPLWTPFFAMSKLSVHAGYASDGDTTFMAPVEQTHTSVGKPDAANMYAEYDVRDRSLGLISRPGYHHYLAEVLAQEIVTALKGMYHV